MATLRVDLETNVATFTSDMKKARQSIEETKTSVEGLGKSLSAIRASAVVYLAQQAFHAAERMYAFGKSIASATMDIERQSKIIGISTDAFQKWQYAAKMTDVSNESLGIGLKQLSKSMEEAVQGTGDGAKWFQAMGVSVKDAAGNMKPLDEMMMEIAGKFVSWEDGPKKIAIAMALFGRSGQELIPILNQGAGGISKFFAEAQKLGIILSSDIVKKGSEAEDIFKRLEAQMNATKLSMAPLVLEFARGIESILSDLNKLNAWLRANKTTDWFPWLKDINEWMRKNSLGNWMQSLGLKAPPEGPQETRFKLPTAAKTQPPSLPDKGKADEFLKTQEQMIQLAMKYYEIEQKLAEDQDDWGERRTHAIEMQEGLYRDLLDTKVKEIGLNEKLSGSEKENLIGLTKGLFMQQEKQRELERMMPRLQAEKKALEEAAAEEVKMNPMFADDAYNMKMLAKEAERVAEAVERERKTREAMPQWQKEYAELTGNFEQARQFQKDILDIERDRITEEFQPVPCKFRLIDSPE